MSGPTKNEKEKFETQSERLERSAYIFGGIVVVGLVMEYWPEFIGAIREGKAPQTTVGAILVTVGVLGEVACGFFAAIFTKRLAVFSASEIAEASKQAADAILLAERERSERVKLEKELSPRWFENQNAAIEQLKPFAGTEVTLVYPPDLECARTAEQLAFVVEEAGWLLNPQPVLTLNPICEEGVTIEGPDDWGGPSASATLIDELNKAGFSATRPPGIPPKSGPIKVWVGLKPRPEMANINKHTAAMEKEIQASIAELRTPELSSFQEAILAEARTLKPGTHGGRHALPRWPTEPR